MSVYLGDFATGATVHFIWATNAVDGSSVTRATNGTVQVYKDNGVTQSTAGVTDTEDFDGLTGLHACTITLATDGTFYSAASNFTVALAGATIDGKSINAVLAHFSIANRPVQGNIAGSVGSVTGAVGSVTGNVGGNVVGSVASVTAATTVGTINANVITASALAADAVDEIWDEVMEGAVTARQSIRLANSANGAKLNGAATTAINIRDLADSKNRVAATVDASGNRTAVTLDLT